MANDLIIRSSSAEFLINDIYDSYELEQNLTSKEFLLVQNEGNRQIKRKVRYYNLDMVISVGYRVGSDRAIQFIDGQQE